MNEEERIILVDGQPMTIEQWEAIANEVLFCKPKTKVELDKYLRAVFGVYLSSVPIDEGNSSPLDFVWDIYSTMIGRNPKPCYNVMAMAGRGTQKSLSGGTIETLMLIQDGIRDWFHCAAIMDQSERTYQYVQKFFNQPWMQSALDGEPKMKETKTIHGTRLQIGTGTIKSVSGFHGSVVMDEYDLMDKIVTKMAKGMLSAQQGQRPFMIYLSSRYFATGNVEDMVNLSVDSDKATFRMHKWGILEMTERCPEEWSGGEEKTVQVWVNEEDLLAISDDELKLLDDKKAADFAPYEAYPNCLSCGIFSFCKGNLKKQQTREQNPFLEPLSETIAKFADNDTETFKSQRLNRKGSTKDLVYPSWNETIHVKTIKEVYEIYMGAPCPEEDPSFEYLINLFLKQPDCFFYYSADPGFTEAAAGLWVVDGMDRIFLIDELTEHGLSDAEFALKIWQTWGHLPLTDGFPDQIPSFMKELKMATPPSELDPKRRKGSMPVNTKVDKSAGSVDAGIQTVRKIIRLPGTLNKTHIYCLSSCTQFRFEMANYRRKMDPKTDTATDVIVKKDDHHPDHARYFLQTMFGKFKAEIRSAHGEKPQTAKAEIEAIDVKKTSFNLDQPLRAPTAGELANAIGVVGFRDNSNKKPKDISKEKRKPKLTFSI